MKHLNNKLLKNTFLDKELSLYKKLINALPKVNGIGTEITLNNTAETPIKLELLPDTKQNSTTGKNLLPKGHTATKNGVTYTVNEDGSVTLNGTSTGDSYIDIYSNGATSLVDDTSKTYTFSKGIENNKIVLNIFERIDNNWVNKLYSTNSSDTYIPSGNQTGQIFRIMSAKDALMDNVTIYPMLVEGTEVGDYEPYTNGPAPNPEFPMPIQVVTGNQVIKVQNKNLCEPQAYPVLVANTYIKANSSTPVISPYTTPNTYRGVGFVAKVEAGVTYTISSDITGFNYSNIVGIYALKSDITDNTKQLEKINGPTFTPNYSGYALIGGSAIATGSTINWSWVQVEKGSQASDYVAHQEQNYPLTLGTLEYCKIGTYSNRIFKNIVGDVDYDSTRELGKWYIKKNIGKYTYDGTQTITIVTSALASLGYYYTIPFSPNSIYTNNNDVPNQLLCSNFNVVANNVANLSNGKITLSSSKNKACIGYNGTSQELNTYLTSNNTTIYYVLETPTYELLSNTLQDQLNALENAISYNNQTNISSIGDLASILNAEAVRDMSGIFELIGNQGD